MTAPRAIVSDPPRPNNPSVMTRYSLPLVALAVVVALPLPAAEPDAKKHWAFQTPVRPAVPEARNPKFEIRNPIDNFVAARLATEKLAPSPEADRVTLCR